MSTGNKYPEDIMAQYEKQKVELEAKTNYHRGTTPIPAQSADTKSDKLIGNSRENEDIKADGNEPAASPTTIINSPTNISKSTTSMEYRSPIRNPESSLNRFIDSRYNAY